MTTNRILTLTLLTTLAIACFSCEPGRYTGGGFTTTGPGKIQNIGFVMDAMDTTNDGNADTWRGQMQYQDPSRNVRLHADMSLNGGHWATLLLDGELTRIHAFQGTYEPQPKTAGAGGLLEVYLYEILTGPNQDKRFLQINCMTGLYAGYQNGSHLGLELEGGTIRIQ